MRESFRKRKLLRSALMALLCTALLCGGFLFLLHGRYRTEEITDFSGITLHDAELSADGHWLTTTGRDPYMLFPRPTRPILSVCVDIASLQSAGGEVPLAQFFYFEGSPIERISDYVHLTEGKNFFATEVKRGLWELRLDLGNRPGTSLRIDRITLNAHSRPLELGFYIVVFLAFFAAFAWGQSLSKQSAVFLVFLSIGLTLLFSVLTQKYPAADYLWVLILGFFFALYLAVLVVLATEKGDIVIERTYLISLLLAAFCLYLFLSRIVPFGDGPDEEMRYDVVRYIAAHGTIPRGDEPEIRNPVWGTSYAFYPLLPYLLAGYLCRFLLLFTKSAAAMQTAARMVSVLASTGTVYLTDRIAGRICKGAVRYALPVACAFFPGFAFASCYVSTEAFAFFATSLVLYFWISGMQEQWRRKDLIGLSVAMALVILSYQNCYGVVLFSIPLCFGTIWRSGRSKKEIAKAAGLVAGLTILLAGWWFVRNGILYHGDIFGSDAWDQAQALYGSKEALQEGYARVPARNGMSLREMWTEMEWFNGSFRSLFAGSIPSFAHPRILQYRLYLWFFALLVLGVLLYGIRIFLPRNRKQTGGAERIVFCICLLGVVLFPFFTSLFYSYYSDFQAQGRYLLPGFTAFFLLSAFGVQTLGVGADSLLRMTGGRKQELGLESLFGYLFVGVILVMNLWFYADASFAYYRYLWFS